MFETEDDQHFHHEVKLMDVHTKEVFYDKLTFVYLEMPKPEDELMTMFDKWLFVLRNLATLLDRPAALQERVFNRLFEAAEIAKFTKRELYEYEDSLKNFRDMYSVITTAELKGLNRGSAEGRAEGEWAERKKNARNLKSLGVESAIISQATGLSKKEIELP